MLTRSPDPYLGDEYTISMIDQALQFFQLVLEWQQISHS